MDALFVILLVLLFPAYCFGCIIHMFFNHRYGEVIRPMIGLLLFRKPKIPADMDSEKVFAIGNNHQRVETFNDMYYAGDRLLKYINDKSWFKTRDKKELIKHLRVVRERLNDEMEARTEANRRWQEKQNAKKQNKQKTVSGWRKVLGVPADCRDPKVIKTSYRKLVSKDHPDKGGTGKLMPELNRALDTARSELNFV